MMHADMASPFSTWLEICLRPTSFFTGVRDEPRVGQATGVALVCSLLGSLGTEATLTIAGQPFSIARVVASSIATLVSVGVGAVVLHGLLSLFQARSRPLATTYAVCAWSLAPEALGVVPVVGGVVGGAWTFIVTVVGLAVVHRTTKARVVFAAVVPTPFLAIAVALGLRVFVLEAFKIPSGSMQPTLLIGDHLFVSKSAYRFGKPPQPADVIVFEFPENRQQDFIKRVVAVGGDTVIVENGHPIVNGRPTPTCKAGIHVDRGEKATRQSVEVELLGGRRYLTLYDEHSFGPSSFGPFVVPAGQFFVLGDNRDNAYDSRGWFQGRGGAVPRENVKGRAWMIWLSLAPGGTSQDGRAGVHLDEGDPAIPGDFEPEVAAGIRRCLAPEGIFQPR